jgi:hypothetical protein
MVTLAEASALSWNALDRALTADAELSVHSIDTGGVLLGAFQRLGEADGFHPAAPRFRRISGGTHLYIAPGSLHVVLAMASGARLLPDANKIVNRYVRPLLRVFGAAYFGRDCFVRAKCPIGFAGFGHDAASGRAVFEALVPASTDWSDASRGSYRGAALAAVAEPAEKIDAIVNLYLSQIGDLGSLVVLPPATAVAASVAAPAPPPDGAPWSARAEEAIGPLFAGRDAAGALAVGGELMASRDVLAALAQDVSSLADPRDVSAVGAAVDRAFSAPRAVLFGVRSLPTVRDLFVSAARS